MCLLTHLLREDSFKLFWELVKGDQVLHVDRDLVKHKFLFLVERLIRSIEVVELLEKFRQERIAHLTRFLHHDHCPRNLNDVPVADHLLLASTRKHSVLEAE